MVSSPCPRRLTEASAMGAIVTLWLPVWLPDAPAGDPKYPLTWWAQLGSNQWPLACKASALPLSYAPLPQTRPSRHVLETQPEYPFAAVDRTTGVGQVRPKRDNGLWPVIQEAR